MQGILEISALLPITERLAGIVCKWYVLFLLVADTDVALDFEWVQKPDTTLDEHTLIYSRINMAV